MSTEKKLTPALLQTLRSELNESVKAVADKHGLTIHFGNATYQDLTATFKVEVAFAAGEGFDPAKEIWDRSCRLIGLDPEDFGKEFCFQNNATRYQICGYDPKRRSNNIIIRRIPDGKIFVTNAQEVRTGLGKAENKTGFENVKNTQVDPTAPAPEENERKRRDKMDWDLFCWKFGMRPEDFGKSVTLEDRHFTICGIKPNARKNAIRICEDRTGTEYVTNTEAVRRAWGQPTS